MLIRFVVSNFLSFNEEREFSMIAGNFKTHKHHVYALPKLNVLKAAAIYGANGAGKSNLVKSIEYLKDLVIDGEIKKTIDFKKFKLNQANKLIPAKFEIEFYQDNKFYSYGVTLTHHSILEEWLYETGINKEDKLIFERKLTKSNRSTIKIAEKYIKNEKDKFLIELLEDNLLKHNELLVSKSSNLKIKEINILQNWISTKLVVIYPGSRFAGLVKAISSSDRFKALANELLRSFDTGVKGLEIHSMDLEKFLGKDNDDLIKSVIDDIESGESVLLDSNFGQVEVYKEDDKYVVKKVVSTHHDNEGKSVVFDVNEESDGTQRMMDFIPAFDKILHSSSTIIIDEIDQSLHPVLLRTLVEKTMSDTLTKGQLIFTTHESNLLDLDIFRQDEIWFVEKESILGSTQMYSLSDFKPRYDLDIKKGYLKGRFGAIPFLADLKALNWQECNEG